MPNNVLAKNVKTDRAAAYESLVAFFSHAAILDLDVTAIVITPVGTVTIVTTQTMPVAQREHLGFV